MADDKKLVQGIRVFSPNAGAPSFVGESFVISLNEFFQFCKDNQSLQTEYNGQKQLKIQKLTSKDGKPYLVVDTYKPGEKSTPAAKNDQPVDDLPF